MHNGAAAFGLLVVACASIASGAGQVADNVHKASFQVSPNPGLLDDRIAIRVTGLPANRGVTIRASSQDRRGHWWRSAAVFAVGGDGAIDLSAQAPASGSYKGADAMGLFWAMQPDRSVRPVPEFFSVVDWFKPVVTEIEAISDGRVLGSSRVVRRFAAPGVSAERVSSDGVVGVLYRPGDGRKHRGVIVLGGSEGGFPAPQGVMLASRGFVTLALAYFGASGLPPAMQRIPIEYFGRAIRTMQGLPDVAGPGVAVVGASRGAEAALIAGSMYPDIDGVVAASASNVRWEGATTRELPGGPAWTYQGKPLAYVPFHIGPGFALQFLWASIWRSPVSLKPMFVDSLARVKSDDVQIPVERIRGPVLLGWGGRDRKWPSSFMSGCVLDRLKRNHHPYADQHLTYEDAGHWLPAEYLPTGGLGGPVAEEIGGTPSGTAAAQRAWWPAVLGFLGAAGAGGPVDHR
jgi:pimeloyl-ACP methyl ester carboxylesterase